MGIRMNEKKFFVLFFSIIGSILISILVLNYVIDYHGIFHGADRKIIKANSINDRFVKLEYLLRGYHKKYDSYLWGSSRVMKTDTQLTGKRTYNMGAAGEMPEECLRDLKMLKSHGVSLNTVYLGLDDFSCLASYEDYKKKLHSFSRNPYDEKINKRLEYYTDLLMSFGTLKVWFKEIRKHESKATIMLHQTGTYIVPQEVENQIEEQTEKHSLDRKFREPALFEKGEFFHPEQRPEQCIETIRELKQFCDENHIRFVPFFNPQHMTTYLNDDMELMNRFKKELVKISPFWDFSGVNYVTSNNYFWYETSHPRAFICDKILDTVSGQNQITWVPDFGVYVTEENVDAFCEKAVRDREAYDPNHEQWVPSAEERAVMTKRVNYSW